MNKTTQYYYKAMTSDTTSQFLLNKKHLINRTIWQTILYPFLTAIFLIGGFVLLLLVQSSFNGWEILHWIVFIAFLIVALSFLYQSITTLFRNWRCIYKLHKIKADFNKYPNSQLAQGSLLYN